MGKETKANRYLKLVTSLTLAPTNGSTGCNSTCDPFDNVYWPDWQKYENASWDNTPQTTVAVYELKMGGKYTTLFGSLDADSDSLVFSWEQIKKFASSCRGLLGQNGQVTLFLFKAKEELFVAMVAPKLISGIDVYVTRFSAGRIRGANSNFRLVVPQHAV
jgi:hypothetical protein